MCILSGWGDAHATVHALLQLHLHRVSSAECRPVTLAAFRWIAIPSFLEGSGGRPRDVELLFGVVGALRPSESFTAPPPPRRACPTL